MIREPLSRSEARVLNTLMLHRLWTVGSTQAFLRVYGARKGIPQCGCDADHVEAYFASHELGANMFIITLIHRRVFTALRERGALKPTHYSTRFLKRGTHDYVISAAGKRMVIAFNRVHGVVVGKQYAA